MRSMLQNEFPSDVLGGEEASHSILGTLTLQEAVKFLDLTCSANKIGSPVTPNESRAAPASIESPETGMNASEERSETNSK